MKMEIYLNHPNH